MLKFMFTRKSKNETAIARAARAAGVKLVVLPAPKKMNPADLRGFPNL